jgi:hypothetical protein
MDYLDWRERSCSDMHGFNEFSLEFLLAALRMSSGEECVDACRERVAARHPACNASRQTRKA